MYFFDPQYGKRKRAFFRDQWLGSLHRATAWFDKAVRDLRHRLEGTVAEATGMFDVGVPSDERLVERVRARLGHVASHPRLIDVDACDGHIALSGHAPAKEIGRIVRSISNVRGVRSIDNQLDDRLGPGVSPESDHRRVAAPIDLMRENWAPGTRLAMGTLGGMLMLNCMVRRTPSAILMGTLGFGLFVRAVGNREIGGLIKEGTASTRPLRDSRSKRQQTAPAR
ncbi:MAG TPA: BON domain-containing protein [Pirellulales bacterium]|nr:BON domain-containing protein [Pirellulales bacterium]